MNRSTLFLCLWFGSATALIAAAIAAAMVLPVLLASQSKNPRVIADAASTFGVFAIPSGYRATRALGAGPIKSLLIEPKGARNDNGFIIFLGRTTPVALPWEKLPTPSDEPSPGLLTPDRYLAHCKKTLNLGAAEIRSSHGTILLRHARCDDRNDPSEVATARFRRGDYTISVVAIGPRREFDITAVRQLLKSFK